MYIVQDKHKFVYCILSTVNAVFNKLHCKLNNQLDFRELFRCFSVPSFFFQNLALNFLSLSIYFLFYRIERAFQKRKNINHNCLTAISSFTLIVALIILFYLFMYRTYHFSYTLIKNFYLRLSFFLSSENVRNLYKRKLYLISSSCIIECMDYFFL